MSEEPLWIGEVEVAELLTLEDSIDTLADAYRRQAAGAAASMRRAHVRQGDVILHAVGGVIAGAEITGTKTWAYTPGGAAPVLVLFSLTDGRLLAVIEAFALGQLRTAGTTGLGTRVLSRPHASTLALLGTGKQAFPQAQAVSCVRSIRRLRLFGRDAARRGELAARLREGLGVEVSEHADVAETLAGADVVTCVTRSDEPIVSGSMLEPGMHLNAVGAIVPTRRELDETAIGRCAVVAADSVEQARDDSGELRAAAAKGCLDWSVVRGLDTLVDQDPRRLRAPDDVTLFKALGVGLADVALGAEILRRARVAEAGRPLPTRAATH